MLYCKKDHENGEVFTAGITAGKTECMRNDYLEAGRFCGTHGIKGDIKAESWCDSVEILLGLKNVYLKDRNGYKVLPVERAVRYGAGALLHIGGYESPEASAVLKNRTFYAKREDIPLEEGNFFIADLLGLPVYDADTGVSYGVLADVSDNAASRIYEVKTPEGQTVYLPAVPSFIIETDIEKGIGIRPIKGMFDEI